MFQPATTVSTGRLQTFNSHSFFTDRCGPAQLIEQKAIVYFSQSAQLIRISCCLPTQISENKQRDMDFKAFQ